MSQRRKTEPCPFELCRVEGAMWLIQSLSSYKIGEKWQIISAKQTSNNMGWFCKKHAELVVKRLNRIERISNGNVSVEHFMRVMRMTK